jgi:hypothetical protein
MKLDPNDLPETIKKLNPHLFVGGVEQSFSKPVASQALDSSRSKCKEGKGRVVISLIRYGARELDSDNLSGSLKPLRDGISATIGIDDGDKRLIWQYSQITTKGHPGVMVTIECV